MDGDPTEAIGLRCPLAAGKGIRHASGKLLDLRQIPLLMVVLFGPLVEHIERLGGLVSGPAGLIVGLACVTRSRIHATTASVSRTPCFLRVCFMSTRG